MVATNDLRYHRSVRTAERACETWTTGRHDVRQDKQANTEFNAIQSSLTKTKNVLTKSTVSTKCGLQHNLSLVEKIAVCDPKYSQLCSQQAAMLPRKGCG